MKDHEERAFPATTRLRVVMIKRGKMNWWMTRWRLVTIRDRAGGERWKKRVQRRFLCATRRRDATTSHIQERTVRWTVSFSPFPPSPLRVHPFPAWGVSHSVTLSYLTSDSSSFLSLSLSLSARSYLFFHISFVICHVMLGRFSSPSITPT